MWIRTRQYITHANQATTYNTDSHNYTTNASWEEFKDDNYGNVGERGKPLLVKRPADSVKQLEEQKHIEVQLFRYNRENRAEIFQERNDGTVLFDDAVLSLMDQFLELENFDRDECTIPEKYLKIRFLMECRNLDYPGEIDAFRNYLAGRGSETQDLLDISDPDEEVNGLKMGKKVSDELSVKEHEQLLRARTRAVYGVLREGVEPPAEALEAHDINIEELTKQAPNIDGEDERQALCNWIEYLIENTIEPLTLFRNHNHTDYDMVDLLGLLATSAYTDRGLETAAKFSEWMYDEENVPKGRSITEKVPELNALVDIEHDFPSDNRYIEHQFNDVFENMLELARKHNFFNGPQDMAVDTTDILWNSMEFSEVDPEDRLTVKIRPKRDIATNRAWRFAVAAITTTESRFTLGVRLLENDSYYPTAVDDLLSKASPYFEIDSIFADAGHLSGDLIREFRSKVDSNWVTKCRERKKGDITNLINITPSDRAGYVENVPWNCEPKPNVIAHPKPYYQEDAREDADDEEAPIPKTPIKFPYRLLEQDDPEAIVTSDGHRLTTLSGDFADTDAEDRSPPPDTPNDLVPTEQDMDEHEDERDIHEYPGETGSLQSERRVGNKSTHEVYLTDRTLPDRSAAGVFYQYYERWAIEVTNNQIKNDFRPFTASKQPELQIYAMNIGALFQNWHTMINRAPSPHLRIYLDVTAEEVLKAIQHYAFCEGDCAPETNGGDAESLSD